MAPVDRSHCPIHAPGVGGSIDLLTALDLLGKAEQERDEANAACESHEVERTMAEARVAELEHQLAVTRHALKRISEYLLLVTRWDAVNGGYSEEK
jgi:predicted lysophospholipase L1 biosynthesis ABC-type transport system permease subunit